MSSEIIGYLCSLLIGLALGTLGSGGSIVTVPIMVYLMNVSPVDATGYSLFVVGVTSGIGFINLSRNAKVDLPAAFVFAIPSILCVFLTRSFLIPAIPQNIVLSGLDFTRDKFFMLLFSILMLVVSMKILLGKTTNELEEHPRNYYVLVLVAMLSGLLTGLLGVGGGFIIIPALMFFGKVSPKMSVGTSLLIIASNSFIGFMVEMLNRKDSIDYKFLLIFSSISVIGVLLGSKILLKITTTQAKKVFGYSVLLVGVYIMIRELFLV